MCDLKCKMSECYYLNIIISFITRVFMMELFAELLISLTAMVLFRQNALEQADGVHNCIVLM